MKKIHQIIYLPAFNDNYIWVIVHSKNGSAVVVDPGVAVGVLDFLEKHQLQLEAIFLTHHHDDHVGGAVDLQRRGGGIIYGPPDAALPFVRVPVYEGDQLVCPRTEITFNVMATPGHTRTHVAYYYDKALFTGDTLFTGGCGRLFEGTPEQLYGSLSRLSGLDNSLLVYCGHEYTEKNLRFAIHAEPGNLALRKRLEGVQQMRAQGLPTVPASLESELQTNPFLRCQMPEIRAVLERNLGHFLADEVAVFTALRQWKDQFS